MKTQILIGHNMRIQKSTVNVFILDESSMAVVSGPVVNITWKRWCSWLGVVKHGSSQQHNNVSQLISLEPVWQICWNLLDETHVAENKITRLYF